MIVDGHSHFSDRFYVRAVQGVRCVQPGPAGDRCEQGRRQHLRGQPARFRLGEPAVLLGMGAHDEVQAALLCRLGVCGKGAGGMMVVEGA